MSRMYISVEVALEWSTRRACSRSSERPNGSAPTPRFVSWVVSYRPRTPCFALILCLRALVRIVVRPSGDVVKKGVWEWLTGRGLYTESWWAIDHWWAPKSGPSTRHFPRGSGHWSGRTSHASLSVPGDVRVYKFVHDVPTNI